MVALLPVVYERFPELFGHYRFYRSCKNLSAGTTVSAARTAMSGFLEVGRTFHPAPGIETELMGATVPEVHESPHEHATRLLFIPDAQNGADWCIVYLDASGSRIARIEIAPD